MDTNGRFVLPEESDLVLFGVKKKKKGRLSSSGTYPYSLCVVYIYPE